MDIKNPGGTPGGTGAFLLGLIMLVVGGYLLMNLVSVNGGYWYWGGFGGYGRTFGITLLPLLFGIGILFANGKSFAGRLLVGIGTLIILAGIILNLDIHIQSTSMFNIIAILILVVGGIGLIVRSVMPMGQPKIPTPPPET